MRKNLILPILLLFSIFGFSQTTMPDKNKLNAMTFDMGFSSKNYMNFNFNVIYNKILFGFEYEMPLKTGVIGENYTTINWDQFPEDRQSSGMYVDNQICFQVGYNIIDKLVLGVGLGIGEEIYYRNMFDDFHILGSNGYYNLHKSGNILLQTKIFANYLIPINNKTYLLLNVQHTKLSGTGGGLGLGFKL